MKGCRPSSSTPYRFANVLSTKHRLKKSTATVESQNTNLIARANSSSLEERRAVFQSLSAFASDPRRRANAPVNTYSALNSAAKLLNNSETTKDKEQKRAMETASVSHDEEHQHAVISFADGAKVQQISETAKDLAKKNCLLSYHSALIAGHQQGSSWCCTPV